MEKGSIPERPMTAFFLYQKEQREKGVVISGKEGGEKWKAMTSAQKKPYIDTYNKAKAKFDAYLESEGIVLKASSKQKVTSYKTSRIETIMEHNEKHKKMSEAIIRGITKVAETFVRDLGNKAADIMKADDKRLVTVEVIEKVLENKKYKNLVKLKHYENILEEANKMLKAEKEKRRKPKSRKSSTRKNKAKEKKSRRKNEKR